MRKVTFLLVLLTLLLCFNSLNAMEIWAEIDGQAVWGDGGDTLDVNNRFTVVIFYNNSEAARLGWSSPFRFFGSGNVENLSYQTAHLNIDFIQLYSPDMYFQSWNGTLPDQICINFVFMSGIQADGVDHALIVFEFEISGNELTEGQFCVEQGDFEDDTYDWMFEDPVPVFETVCWPVKSSPPICGDANDNLSINILDVTYIINYLYAGGPEPYNINMADVNHDCVINILDVTYLITYLYMGGPAPDCPTVWPCRKGDSSNKDDLSNFNRINFISE